MQKFEYLKNKKSFDDEIKNILYIFWRAIIWWKSKIIIKKQTQALSMANVICQCMHIPNRKNLYVNFSSLIYPGSKLGKSYENQALI